MTLNSTENEILDTLQNIQAIETKRMEKKKMVQKNQDPNTYDRSEYFLDGKQKVTQIGNSETFEAWNSVVFPFSFTLPENLPPTIQAIYFEDQIISTKYFIVAENFT